MSNYMTYRDLKLWLDLMTPTELDMTATINRVDQEEVYPVTGSISRIKKNINDVLDDGHPVIDVKI